VSIQRAWNLLAAIAELAKASSHFSGSILLTPGSLWSRRPVREVHGLFSARPAVLRREAAAAATLTSTSDVAIIQCARGLTTKQMVEVERPMIEDQSD